MHRDMVDASTNTKNSALEGMKIELKQKDDEIVVL